MNLEKENNQRKQQLDQGVLLFLPGGTQVVLHNPLLFTESSKLGDLLMSKCPTDTSYHMSSSSQALMVL